MILLRSRQEFFNTLGLLRACWVGCRLHSTFGIPMVMVPCQSVVYGCALAPTAATVSRFCAVMLSIGKEIEAVQQTASADDAQNGLDNVNFFN